jgi:branched-chain amino acid transport system ATP-binding protein
VTILTISNLSAGYGNAPVISDVNLSVDDGDIAVVLGANGAGKTTLMRALSGMIRSSGRVELSGTDISGYLTHERARVGLAHVPQGRGTFSNLTVMENLKLGAISRANGPDIARDIEKWLTIFPVLATRLNQRAGTMSGGEQQMLAIARGLMSNPRLLLVDEPSLGLSPKITIDLFRLLAELNVSTGLSLLLVEQNAQLALNIATKSFFIESGCVREVEEATATREQLKRAYLSY